MPRAAENFRGLSIGHHASHGASPSSSFVAIGRRDVLPYVDDQANLWTIKGSLRRFAPLTAPRTAYKPGNYGDAAPGAVETPAYSSAPLRAA